MIQRPTVVDVVFYSGKKSILLHVLLNTIPATGQMFKTPIHVLLKAEAESPSFIYLYFFILWRLLYCPRARYILSGDISIIIVCNNFAFLCCYYIQSSHMPIRQAIH